jgi:hypothetical protein
MLNIAGCRLPGNAGGLIQWLNPAQFRQPARKRWIEGGNHDRKAAADW